MSEIQKNTPTAGWLQRLVGPWVWMSVCCNDGRTGQFDGKASAVEINGIVKGKGDMDLTFEPVFFEEHPKFSFSDGGKFIRLCRVKLPFEGYQAHVGNWCWDAYKVRTEDVEKLLASPLFRKNYTAEHGSTLLWDAWESALGSNTKTEARQ
ncbi:MAG: hypothetical protein QM680_13985 [Luteolibacter sp.]